MNSFYKESGQLTNNWYAAGRIRQFKQNAPNKVTIYEIPLVIWKMKDGKFTALLDRCAHRNTPLSEGRVIDDCISCPYHGWQFNANGECVNIPAEGGAPENVGLKNVKSFPIEQKYGLVWVWMGIDRSPDKEIFPMPTKENDRSWKSYYMQTRFNNDVTDLVENFMDVPHTVYVHKSWFRSERKIEVGAEVERLKDSVHVTYDQPRDSIGFSERIINPKKLPLTHTDKFYMPNNTRVDYLYGKGERGFIITSTCTPIRPLQTEVYTLITYKFGWMTAFIQPIMHWYTKKVIIQDVWIMDIHGKNVQKFEEKEYRSTESDSMHVYIEQLRDQAKNGDQNTLLPVKHRIKFWI